MKRTYNTLGATIIFSMRVQIPRAVTEERKKQWDSIIIEHNVGENKKVKLNFVIQPTYDVASVYIIRL